METVKNGTDFKRYLLKRIDDYFREDFEKREQLSKPEYAEELLILVKGELEQDFEEEANDGSR